MDIKIIFLVIVSIINSAMSARLKCCPDGQGLLRKRNQPLACWDPKTNDTTLMSTLECNTTAVFTTKVLNFTINENSELQIEELEPIESGSFCIENMILKKNFNLSNTVPAVVLCNEEEEVIIDASVLGYCLIVTVIFLGLTAIVYIVLPELRDLQGKSIVNFCGSFAIGLAILAIMKLMSYTDMNLCAVRGFLAYFFLVAGFFWSNAISIQVLLSIRRPSTTSYGWKEFKWYALYAWGCPVLLTTIMAIMNYYPGTQRKPGIGLNHCWFFSGRQQWIYLYSVMTILIVANICIFIYISVLLWRHTFSSSHIKALRYKFTMTVRLFVVMGVPWIFEMISSAFSTHIAWVCVDVFNTLQGPIIFLLLVVFRRKVIKALYKHGYLCCLSGPVEKYLATAEDDEDNIVEHTMVISMNEK